MNKHVARQRPKSLPIVLREKCHSLWHFLDRGRKAMSTSLFLSHRLLRTRLFALPGSGPGCDRMVLDSVRSTHSKRNYAKRSMTCFPSVPADLSPALCIMEYRITMDHLSPSTINVRLSAIRKLVGEARRNGLIGLEEAANLSDVPTSGKRERDSATG